MTAIVACTRIEADGRPFTHIVDYYSDTDDEAFFRDYAVEYAKAFFYGMYRVRAEYFTTKIVLGKVAFV